MTTSQQLQTYLERALQDGLAEISGAGRAERIRYVAADADAQPKCEGGSTPQRSEYAQLNRSRIQYQDCCERECEEPDLDAEQKLRRQGDLVLF